jgi:transcriptional antiterminator RfaH
VIDIRKPHWVVAYTKPRNEKKALALLIEEGIEAYLPLQKTLKQWSDRKKWIEEPLLRSYIFIRITEQQYYNTIQIPGLVRYVSFEGKAAPIPDNQIDMLKILVGEKYNLEVTEESFLPGEIVEITIGSLAGFKGELIRHNGKNKVMLKVEHISHSILVTLPRGQIKKFT